MRGKFRCVKRSYLLNSKPSGLFRGAFCFKRIPTIMSLFSLPVVPVVQVVEVAVVAVAVVGPIQVPAEA